MNVSPYVHMVITLFFLSLVSAFCKHLITLFGGRITVHQNNYACAYYIKTETDSLIFKCVFSPWGQLHPHEVRGWYYMCIAGITLPSIFHTIHLLAKIQQSHLNNFPVKSRMQFISISISIVSISKTECRLCNLSFALSLSGYLVSLQRLCHCQWIRD